MFRECDTIILGLAPLRRYLLSPSLLSLPFFRLFPPFSTTVSLPPVTLALHSRGQLSPSFSPCALLHAALRRVVVPEQMLGPLRVALAPPLPHYHPSPRETWPNDPSPLPSSVHMHHRFVNTFLSLSLYSPVPVCTYL